MKHNNDSKVVTSERERHGAETHATIPKDSPPTLPPHCPLRYKCSEYTCCSPSFSLTMDEQNCRGRNLVGNLLNDRL
jgi:hypothetical protein